MHKLHIFNIYRPQSLPRMLLNIPLIPIFQYMCPLVFKCLYKCCQNAFFGSLCGQRLFMWSEDGSITINFSCSLPVLFTGLMTGYTSGQKSPAPNNLKLFLFLFETSNNPQMSCIYSHLLQKIAHLPIALDILHTSHLLW